MELREPIIATEKAKLVEVLETPTLTGVTRQNHGGLIPWLDQSE